MADEQWPEHAQRTLRGVEAMGHMQPFFDTLDGMINQARARGFTDEQARDIVAYVFGWRPADGTTPDGV